MTTDFATKFRAGEPLLGTFVKTPTSHNCEILGAAGFDFAIIDQEHAPIGRVALDQMLLGCRVSGLAGLVRVPSPEPSALQSALDCGAAGVLVPHVSTPERARALVAGARYRGGERGFSNTNRAGAYGGTGMADHIAAQDSGVLTLAMIEDASAIDVIDDILAVPGLDGIFIGQGDLTVSLGAPNSAAPEVRSAVDKVLAAAKSAGCPVAIMVRDAAGAEALIPRGASAFVISNDQGLMRSAALNLAADFQPLRP
ncbi:HpcH/HpaI aldolase family protein [Pseudoroseicyclus sp. H15]